MSIWSSVTAADGAAFIDADAMGGESVTYTKTDGTTRTITVIVDRRPPAKSDSMGQIITPMALVHVRNDATYGIAASEVDVGGDTITLAMRPGATAVAHQIQWADGSPQIDAGMLTFEIR